MKRRNISDRIMDAAEDTVKRGVDPEIAAFLHGVPYDPRREGPEPEKTGRGLPGDENSPAWRLKAQRLTDGLTQAQLAEKAHISLRTLQDYEQGKKRLAGASAETVERLAHALGVTTAYLLNLQF